MLDDGVDKWIVPEARPLQVGAVRFEVGERPVRQVGPVAPLLVEEVGCVELGSMAYRLDRLDGAEASLHRRARRMRPPRPVRQRKADRLPQLIAMLGHDRPFLPGR